MFFTQRAARESSLSDLFGCSGHAKAVAADVVLGDEDWFMEHARVARVAITHVIDTHVHADHYSGARSPRIVVACTAFMNRTAPR